MVAPFLENLETWINYNNNNNSTN